MRIGTIEIPNRSRQLTIAHATYGHRSPILVLLHGGSGSRSHWARNMEPLSEYFTVVALDMPGYGDSGDIPPDTAMDEYIGLVCDAITGILPEGATFHLAGFSYGGLTASGVAVHLPQRVRGLTLLAPSGFGKPVNRKIVLKKRGPGMSDAELTEVYRHNVQDMMLHLPDSVDDATVALYRYDIERARFRNWQLSWSDVLPQNLTRMRCQVQLIWGEEDRTANPTLADRVQRCRAVMPGVPVTILPKTGHWAQYERANDVNRLVTQFHLNLE